MASAYIRALKAAISQHERELANMKAALAHHEQADYLLHQQQQSLPQVVKTASSRKAAQPFGEGAN